MSVLATPVHRLQPFPVGPGLQRRGQAASSVKSRLSVQLTPLALAAYSIVQMGTLQAQTVVGNAVTPANATPTQAALMLQPLPLLMDAGKPLPNQPVPTYMVGDALNGRLDEQAINQAHTGQKAQLRRPNVTLVADAITYDQPTDTAKTTGPVRIQHQGDTYTGQGLTLKLDTFTGSIDDVRYTFAQTGGTGQAKQMTFLDRDRTRINQADYTTCLREEGSSDSPAWMLKASQVDLDQAEDVGYAKNAVVQFMGVPILATPWMSFPLSDKRKTGVLPPTLALDDVNGFEIAVPYYWNIAPQRDLTLTPKAATKRGLTLDGEFRYLTSIANGNIRISYLPNDKLRDENRWAYSVQNQVQLVSPDSAVGSVSVTTNLNEVSDDNYWRDHPGAYSYWSQRLLPSELALNWSKTNTLGSFTSQLRQYKWQTLQDSAAPITAPYDRLPQWTVNYHKSNAAGFNLSAETDITQFETGKDVTPVNQSRRSLAAMQIERPFVTPGWFITPAVRLQNVSYSPKQVAAGQAFGESASYSIPSATLDSGLIFERELTLADRSLIQTLEPRVFYTYTPYRDQSKTPNYDSAFKDVNTTSLFSSNPYSGYSRVADLHAVTAGVSSKLLSQETGAEYARVTLAHQQRLDDLKVALDKESVVTERTGATVAAASINWTPVWSTEAAVQYESSTQKVERTTFTAKYRPGEFRVLNLAYRSQRTISEYIDASWQWPLGFGQTADAKEASKPCAGRWFGLGQVSTNLKDSTVEQAAAGVEYASGCWVGRFVMEGNRASDGTLNRRTLFQLELVGLGSIGQSLQGVQANIPQYQPIGNQRIVPNRFADYQ